jgi:hypothetical protein
MVGWPFARGRVLMSKLSPRATKALSELEALAKSRTAERAAKPKLSPADRIDAVARDFVLAQVAMAKPVTKPPAASPVPKPKPALRTVAQHPIGRWEP